MIYSDNNKGGLETAFDIVSYKMVINYLLFEYMKRNKISKYENFSYKEFLLYAIDYGGSDVIVSEWVEKQAREILKEKGNDCGKKK